MAAISGYGLQSFDRNLISNKTQTEAIVKFSREVGYELPKNSYYNVYGKDEDGILFNVSHCEFQLGLYWVKTQLRYARLPVSRFRELKDFPLPTWRRKAEIVLGHFPCHNVS